jgi:hypothetical protein
MVVFPDREIWGAAIGKGTIHRDMDAMLVRLFD